MLELDILPQDLEEAIEILKTFYGELQLDKIKLLSEKDYVNSVHFHHGMFIRNSWQLWWYFGHPYEGWSKTQPKLNKWFNEIEITHADDMSSIILTCLYRNLKGKPYNIEKQVAKYHKHWKKNGYPDGIPKHN